MNRNDGTALEMVQTLRSDNRPNSGDTIGIFLDGKTRTLHLFKNGQPYHPKQPVFADSRLLDQWDFTKLDLVPAVCFPGNYQVARDTCMLYSKTFADMNFKSPPSPPESGVGASGVEILGFRESLYCPKMTFCKWRDDCGRVAPSSAGADSSSERVSMIEGVKSYEGGWRRGQFHGRDCTLISWPLENAGGFQLDRSRGRFSKGLRRGVHELSTTQPVSRIPAAGKSKRAGPPRRSEDDRGDTKYPSYGSLACYGVDGIGENMYPSVKCALRFAWAEEVVECEFDKITGRKVSGKPRQWVGSTTRQTDFDRKSLAQIFSERMEQMRASVGGNGKGSRKSKRSRGGFGHSSSSSSSSTTSSHRYDEHGKPACRHGHSLVPCMRKTGWSCDARGEEDGCQSRDRVKGQDRWRCADGCDFDYCGACYDFKCRRNGQHLEAIAKEKKAEQSFMLNLVESVRKLEAEDADTSGSDEEMIEEGEEKDSITSDMLVTEFTERLLKTERSDVISGTFEGKHDRLFLFDRRNVISLDEDRRQQEWSPDYEEGGRRWRPPVEISEDLQNARLVNGARKCLVYGNRGFSSGVHYWEVEITGCEWGSMCIGVSEGRRKRVMEVRPNNYDETGSDMARSALLANHPSFLQTRMGSRYGDSRSARATPWGDTGAISPASAFAASNPPTCDLGRTFTDDYDPAMPRGGSEELWGDYGFVSYRCSINPEGQQLMYGAHYNKGHKLGVLLDMDRGVVAFVLDGMSRVLHKNVTDNLGVAHRFVRSGGRDMSAPGHNYGDTDDRGSPGAKHLTLFPTFSFSKPDDAVSLCKMKHISIPGKQARAQLDDILHAALLMQRWRAGLAGGKLLRLPRPFLRESYLLLQNWAHGLKEHKTRAGISVVMDPREQACSSSTHGLVCKGGNRYKMDRGVAVVLGAYRGHVWYRLEDEREEEREHAGNAWYWTKDELASQLKSGDIKVAKDKAKKKKTKKTVQGEGGTSETGESGVGSESESEDEDDDPVVEEGAQTLAMYIGDQGFSERECRDLVLMNEKSCDAAVAFVFSGVDAKAAAIEWRAARNAEKKEKKEAKEKRKREKEAARSGGSGGEEVGDQSCADEDNLLWRSRLNAAREHAAAANGTVGSSHSASCDMTFEQFEHWMDDPRWQESEGAPTASALSFSSRNLDQALVACVNIASDATSKEPKHLSQHDLAHALADLPDLQQSLMGMLSKKDTGSGDGESKDAGELQDTGDGYDGIDIVDSEEVAEMAIPDIFLARFAALLNLNTKMAQLLPLIDLSLQRNRAICVNQSPGSFSSPSSPSLSSDASFKYLSGLGRQTANLRGIFFRSTKLKYWRCMLRATTVPITPPMDELDRPDGIPKIRLNRIKARKERLQSLMDFSTDTNTGMKPEGPENDAAMSDEARESALELKKLLGSMSRGEAAVTAFKSSLLGQLESHVSFTFCVFVYGVWSFSCC